MVDVVRDIHIVGDRATVVIVADSARWVESGEQGRVAVAGVESERRIAETQPKHSLEERTRPNKEEFRARAHPYRYAEDGPRAYGQAEARDSRILFWWTAVLVATAILWALWSVGLPGGLAANVLAIGLGSALIGALAVIPGMILAVIPAAFHAALLDSLDERDARTRAEPRERAERLATETSENDRRLRELGIDV